MRLVSSKYNTNVAFLAVSVDKSSMYNKGNKGPRIENESGKTFLVPVPDRTADILKVIIDVWIELGTTVVIVGERTGISTRKFTHTAPLTTPLASLRAYRRPHKYYREDVAPCEAVSESLQQEGGLHTSPSSLHVRGEVKGREA